MSRGLIKHNTVEISGNTGAAFTTLPNEIRSLILQYYLNFQRVIHVSAFIEPVSDVSIHDHVSFLPIINLKLASPSTEQFRSLGSNTLHLFHQICAKHQMTLDEFLTSGPPKNTIYMTNVEEIVKKLDREPERNPRRDRVQTLALDPSILQQLLPYEMMTPHFAGKLNWSRPVRHFFDLFPNLDLVVLVVKLPVLMTSSMEELIPEKNVKEEEYECRTTSGSALNEKSIVYIGKTKIATRLQNCEAFWETYYGHNVKVEVACFMSTKDKVEMH